MNAEGQSPIVHLSSTIIHLPSFILHLLRNQRRNRAEIGDLGGGEVIGLHLTDTEHANDLTVGADDRDGERALDVRLLSVGLGDAAEVFLEIAKLDGFLPLRGATGDALAERDIVDLRQQHRENVRRDALMGDQRQQARGRIRAMNRTRGAGEVRQHFDKHR